jgi:hypothetical protein
MIAPTPGRIQWGVTSIGGYADMNDLTAKTNGKGHVTVSSLVNAGASGTDFVQNILTGSISHYTSEFAYNVN